MAVPAVHHPLSSFDPCNDVTAPEGERAVLVLFAMVVAFLAAGADEAARNMRGAIAKPRWVKTIRLHDRAVPAAVLAVVRADRNRTIKDRIGSGMRSSRDAGEGALERRAAHAEETTRIRTLLTASLAASHLVLVASFYWLIVRRQDVKRLLENLAMTEPLTGLANRRAVETALEAAVSRAKRYSSELSVIFLDVDDFKQINDRFGHKVGDDVLRAIARVVLSSLRAEDVAGRYGGEEFLVVLPETDEAGSVEVAERIRTAVRALDLPLPPVTISLGVATLGAQSSSVAALVAKADEALYVSKHGGRDRVTHFHREPLISLAKATFFG